MSSRSSKEIQVEKINETEKAASISSPDKETTLDDVEVQREVESDEDNKSIFQRAWTKKLLWTAYAIVIFTAFVENFASDSTSSLDSYATSSFNAHSLIATVAVVYKITAICAYPILAKLADLFGRGEGFSLAVAFYTIAYILYSSCQNVQTYVCAEIFFAIGKNGYRVFQQIFIADTSSMINRGILSQLPDALGAIPSLYAGTYVMDAFLEHSTWRWGYGSFAIILACSLIPLAIVMFYLDHRAKKSGERKDIKILADVDPTLPWYKKAFQVLFVELDIFGGLLLLCGMALFFVPFTLTGKSSPYKWHEGKLIAMLVIGFVIFCAFLVWNMKIAKKPFVPTTSLKHKSCIIIIILVALDLCENSSFATYFTTTLQVSGYYTAGEATRVDNSKKVTVDIFSVFGGLLMKYSKRSKIWALMGVPMVVLGHGLLVWFMRRDGEMASYALLVMAEVFIGFGRGMYQCACQVIMQSIAGIEGVAMSTAFFLAFQSIGSLIGSAIAGGIWNSLLIKKLNAYLPADSTAKATKIYKSINVALKYKKGTAERDAIERAYAETIQVIGWAGLGIIAPMLILVWFLREVKLTEEKDIYEGHSVESSSDEKEPETEKSNKWSDKVKNYFK